MEEVCIELYCVCVCVCRVLQRHLDVLVSADDELHSGTLAKCIHLPARACAQYTHGMHTKLKSEQQQSDSARVSAWSARDEAERRPLCPPLTSLVSK